MAGDNQGGGLGNGYNGSAGGSSWPQQPNTHPETSSFGPVGPSNGQQRNPFEGEAQFGATPMYQQAGSAPYYAGQYGQAPVQKTSTAPIIVAIVLVLVLLAGGGVGAYFFFGKNSDSQEASAPMSTQAPANTEASPTFSDSTPRQPEPARPPEAESRPQYPPLPGYAVAANEAARNNRPGGDFNNVYMGSSVTSEPFANAVRDAYVRNYLDTRNLNATLNVYSTVTGRTYTMRCSDNGSYVTCTGGNNAVVYIV